MTARRVQFGPTWPARGEVRLETPVAPTSLPWFRAAEVVVVVHPPLPTIRLSDITKAIEVVGRAMAGLVVPLAEFGKAVGALFSDDVADSRKAKGRS